MFSASMLGDGRGYAAHRDAQLVVGLEMGLAQTGQPAGHVKLEVLDLRSGQASAGRDENLQIATVVAPRDVLEVAARVDYVGSAYTRGMAEFDLDGVRDCIASELDYILRGTFEILRSSKLGTSAIRRKGVTKLIECEAVSSAFPGEHFNTGWRNDRS